MGDRSQDGSGPGVNGSPFFFPGEFGQKIFGVLHKPEETDRRCGLVFCHPLFEEKLWSHRMYVSFARVLSASGYTVLRFDARGHGDSDGEHRDISLDSMLSDLDYAVSVLKQGRVFDRVGLLGLRAGAFLAAKYAASRSGINFHVMWQPILDGSNYIQDCLRSNMVTQMVLYGEPRENRKEMMGRLAAGGTVSVDGYMLGKALFEQISGNRVDPENCRKIPTLVVQIEENCGQPIKTLYSALTSGGNYFSKSILVREEPFWKETRRYVQRSEKLFIATVEWLNSVCDGI